MAAKKKTVDGKFDEMENVEQSEMVFANMKRTYDAHQSHDSKVFLDAQENSNTLRSIINQHLANTVDTANMIAKQAVRHCDIAIDRQWNVDEQGYTVADILNDSKFQDAIATSLAKIVADMASTAKK